MNAQPVQSASSGHCVLTALLAIGLTSAAFADSSPSSSSTPARSSYIEQPQPVTTYTTYSSIGDGPYYSGSSYYGRSYGPSSGYSYSTTIQPQRYFFPPAPPALGEAFVSNRTRSASLVRNRIPQNLSEHLNEPFYSPLATFLYDESLSKRRQKILDEYIAAKSGVLAELRAKIDSLKNADPATREAELSRFAQEQTPRVEAAEALAYKLRDELTNWSLFAGSADWNDARQWRLGDNTHYETTQDESKAARGTAFYQDGLSPAQRRALRELSMELDDSGKGITSEISLDARGPYLYFSPELSRIKLPANLPADLQAKVLEYGRLKAAIKRDLREVLYREDRRFWDSKRAAAFRDLAARQESQFAEVDRLAEEIRRGLVKLPNPAKPTIIPQALPAGISEKVSAYLDRRNEYLRVMTAKSDELKHQFRTSRVEFVKFGNGFGIQLVGSRKLSDAEKAQVEAAKAQLIPFNEQQAAIYASIASDKEAIRTALVQSAGTIGPMVTQRIVDIMLREYMNTMAAQELWNQYREYEIAVLEPGLSPAQRRLLFNAALVKMDLHIPTYTY